MCSVFQTPLAKHAHYHKTGIFGRYGDMHFRFSNKLSRLFWSRGFGESQSRQGKPTAGHDRVTPNRHHVDMLQKL